MAPLAAALALAALAGQPANLPLDATLAGPQGNLTLNATLNATGPSCSDFKDCTSCTNASTWTGAHCRWCPLPNDNACHAEGSLFNKCKAKEQITDPIECPGAPGKLPHQPMPTELHDMARTRMHEAYASYCPLDKILAWNCKWCQQLGPHNVTAATFNDTTHAQAYVAYAAGPPERIVIAIRGTKGLDIKNWVLNVKFFPISVEWLPAEAQVHRGFLEAYESIRPAILQGLQKALAICPSCPIRVTGHSLGGAQAAVCATDIAAHNKQTPVLFTFGAPRAGDPNFVYWFRKNIHEKQAAHRMVHQNDIVPHVPTNNMGFHHLPREIWETGDGEGQYTMCDNDGEDHTCSWQIDPTKYDVNDHYGYMGDSEGCE
eukprot:TRINITY_DN2761_c0_g2_i1.p2 TRINITY_DN2761_c0_g2~~TRINITY_DN2761_c0_g2_i1.p2  ORF type:complete len:408 (+),score=126.19 TRINITY_DN2761_c0_g2_i1:104-1225(+)